MFFFKDGNILPGNLHPSIIGRILTKRVIDKQYSIYGTFCKNFSNKMYQSFYLTKNGLKRIKKEYQDLKCIKLSKIKEESLGFLSSGDLNTESPFSKENLFFLERKIAKLENVLRNVKLIKIPSKQKQNIINLGATVVLEERNGKINELTIVGVLETNPNKKKISFKSPLGKSLLGHKIGDEIMTSFPMKIIYKIKKIKYYSIN